MHSLLIGASLEFSRLSTFEYIYIYIYIYIYVHYAFAYISDRCLACVFAFDKL